MLTAGTRLLQPHTAAILLVFDADVLEDIRIGLEQVRDLHSEWPGVPLGIVDHDRRGGAEKARVNAGLSRE